MIVAEIPDKNKKIFTTKRIIQSFTKKHFASNKQFYSRYLHKISLPIRNHGNSRADTHGYSPPQSTCKNAKCVSDCELLELERCCTDSKQSSSHRWSSIHTFCRPIDRSSCIPLQQLLKQCLFMCSY